MAARRPVTSRARVNNNLNPMPPPQQLQRPKSVMSRPPSASSQRVSSDIQESSGTSSKRQGDDGDTNIQVILRCRARSQREIDEEQTVIVDIDGEKAKELIIQTAKSNSSLGMHTRAPTRTYTYDIVFGPEATQSMVFHDVVAPMVKEVTEGYNCTVFAYGQTGTGKTYTMQGELAPSPVGGPAVSAGIIPRVLFRLFHELEKAHTDFIVKISYIELYNEELRDLLAAELSAPSTLTQPMGKDAKGGEQKLNIFDDVNKRGVIIQGLEEIPVKDSKQALALLTKGSERRQIAATNFNEHSSRSHSIFSITVQIKEPSAAGDDLIKIGKLNLVDLAGSENIGRSGAENKRAREAGMINQSLLTLGRVINALVDKSQHVPYRESKLTRLLQDSLGGRTKTCIIATISPSSLNYEETISTLDYALRAKSIRNKPEVNQRMTRNSLLKDYIIEIEQLKADLLAAREKNGIYFSEETWKQRVAESELRETELIEAKKQVTIIENQMRAVRDEYDQSIALLKRREEELEETRGVLKQTENNLRQREVELAHMTEQYEKEVVVRKAHQQTEASINGVALGLKKVTEESLRDLGGAFEKLDRKNNVFASNRRIVSENEELIRAYADALMKKLTELDQLMKSLRGNVEEENTMHLSSQQQAIIAQVEKVNVHFEGAQDLFQQIEKYEGAGERILSNFKDQLNKAYSSFTSEVSSWSEKATTECTQYSNNAMEIGIGQLDILEESISILTSLLNRISRDVQIYLHDERASLTELRKLAETSTAQELQYLQRQNEILAEMLINERKAADKAKNDLLQRVSGLLGDFLQQRDESLRESVGSLQRSNAEVTALLKATCERQSDLYNNLSTTNGELQSQMGQANEEGNEEKEKTIQNTATAKAKIGTSLKEVETAMTSSITSHSTWANRQIRSMGKSLNSAFEEYNRAKRARVEAIDGMHANIESHHSVQHNFLVSISNEMERHGSQVNSSVKEQSAIMKEYQVAASKNLESVERARATIANMGNKDDIPTGSTPRKRKWQYVDEWALTQSREELLKNWKQDPVADDESSEQEDRPESSSSHRTSDAAIRRTHIRTDSVQSENVALPILEVQEGRKFETVKKADSPAEPLVESRKRNVSTLRTRRAR
uniref:Kinesin motor domain-containing protein n=1 Tax=Psilocybe cubensis TaxID=181762 RepID=A0A8H7Y5S6_PSICU